MEKKSTYRRFTDSDGTKHCIRHDFVRSTEEECTICINEKSFIEDFEYHASNGCLRRMKNLAISSLRRHLATGKHWRLVSREPITIY